MKCEVMDTRPPGPRRSASSISSCTQGEMDCRDAGVKSRQAIAANKTAEHCFQGLFIVKRRSNMARAKSTIPGHVNPQKQLVIRRVGPSDSIPGQSVYELQCQLRLPDGTVCGKRYGANGCDIDGAGAGTGRLCPRCQGGRPGEPI